MTNLQKRILTSLVIFPLTIFFILKGGYFLLSFLFIVFLTANYELFLVFKKKLIILLINLILILALFSIYHLREDHWVSTYILVWVIILCVCSDIGGYVLGKIFKWKKLTSISPNKTVSGVLGSFIFSFLSLLIMEEIVMGPLSQYLESEIQNLVSGLSIFTFHFLVPKYFFLSIVFSMTAQTGDLVISYFKRLEKVKDIGKILPGHGGIFDRIDGLMFVVILAFILDIFKVFP